MFESIQRLQRNIHEKDKLIQQLNNQINQCQQKHKGFQENEKQKEFTIPQLTAQRQLIDKENTIELLQNKLAALTWQNLIMKQNYSQRGEAITKLQIQVLQLERKLAVRQTQLQLIKIDNIYNKNDQNNQDSGNKFENYEKIIENLNEQFQEAISEKINLVQENTRLKISLEQMTQKYKDLNEKNLQHIQKIEEYISEINRRTVMQQQSVENPSSKNVAQQYILNQQFGKDKYVTYLQGQVKKYSEMLNDKENQIYLLFLDKAKKQQSKQQNISLDAANMMHTIKQLKKCINERSLAMVQALKKCNEANKVMNELQQALKNTQQLAQKNKKLVEELAHIKQQCSKLKQEKQEYKDKVTGLQRNIETHNKNLEDILLENECYHKLVYKQLGQSKYQFFIEDQKKQLAKKYEERQKQRKWVTISELIQTNMRLMQQITKQQ